MEKPSPDAAASQTDRRSGPYGWYVVAVLSLAYILSFADRQILTLMVQPIRNDLDISDVQISLLHGLAFALFYTILGIPIARWADSGRRTRIIAIGALVWSLMTALCGMARNFPQLFLARVGVGTGEAALSPAAYSLLADYFPPHRLAKALSLYSCSLYIGAGLALIGGGALIDLVAPLYLPYLGRLEPWQIIFILIGLPGIPVGLLIFSLREPQRRDVRPVGGEVGLRAVGLQIAAHRGTYGFLIFGYSVASLMWNGVSAWGVTFFIRQFGWSAAEIGGRYGLAMLMFGSAGIIFGGWLSGWLERHGRSDGSIRVGIASALGCLAPGTTAPLSQDGMTAMAMFCLFIFCGAMPYGCAAAALQRVTPNRMRAQISALYLFGVNLAGIGCGPTAVALLSEKVFSGGADLRYALSIIVGAAAPISALLLHQGCRHFRRDSAALAQETVEKHI